MAEEVREIFPLMMFGPRPEPDSTKVDALETPQQVPLLRQAASRDFRPIDYERQRVMPAPGPRQSPEDGQHEGEEVPKASSATDDANSSPSGSPTSLSEPEEPTAPSTPAEKESPEPRISVATVAEVEQALTGTTGSSVPPAVDTSLRNQGAVTSSSLLPLSTSLPPS